jgi:hypothetical protein
VFEREVKEIDEDPPGALLPSRPLLRPPLQVGKEVGKEGGPREADAAAQHARAPDQGPGGQRLHRRAGGREKRPGREDAAQGGSRVGEGQGLA